MAISMWLHFALYVVHTLAVATGQQPLPLAFNPYPNHDRLAFSSQKFKLTVFSDLHFGENPWHDWGREQDANSTRLMRRVLATEKPDFVAISGDLITGENTFKENSTLLIDQLTLPMREKGIPFASCHGNHDNNPNITHLAEIKRENYIAPRLSYTRVTPGIGGADGPGNFWVPVYATKHSLAPILILWFFDSRSGHSANGTQLPDFVDPSVAKWIKEENARMDVWWGKGKRNSLAFVHIPPHIVESLQQNLDPTTPGLNDDSLAGDGSIQSTSPGITPPGQDEPFWTAVGKYIPNLFAVVSGHDHGNEWCALDSEKEITFCFAKHSGYGGYSSDGWGYGVRNFEFGIDSKSGKMSVRTWIRLEEGEIKAEMGLPLVS
ncbi:Metallo-dependent phosphatase [Flagelloscypha sp. PMI_526]|nr:Metallo-dependent phosphatase [Flagelloscypha sp. PMI_526]